MVRLGGLWVNKDTQGNTFLSGEFGNFSKMLILKNLNKSKDNQPDYHVFLCEKEKKEVQTPEL